MSRIIAIANQKGGVGKSATAINLGACLGALNKKTLIVDMDPQQHINLGFGIHPREVKVSSYDLLMDQRSDPASMVIPCSDSVHIIPSHLDLALAENELMGKVASDRRLLNQLSRIREEYDFILIDCPPSLGLLTINSLIACDEVIITIEPEYLAMQGVVRLLKLLREIMDAHQKEMIFYTLITRFDGRTNLARDIVDEIRTKFGKLCFNTYINSNVKIREAMSQGVPVIDYDKNCKGCQDYNSLAQEISDIDRESLQGVSLGF